MELFFYLKLVSRVRVAYNKMNELADFKHIVSEIFYWRKNENVVNWHQILHLNAHYSIGVKNYPSLLFFPLLPTFLGVGGAC